MEGIDPMLLERIINSLKELLLDNYPKAIADEFKKFFSGKSDVALKDNLTNIGKGILDKFKEDLDLYRHKKHINPVMSAVSFLPKEELALMAETIVSLTSFKRKISLDAAETVGGPIDVAVISKGDGFVWIKRKHYFNKELNPNFVTSYYTK